LPGKPIEILRLSFLHERLATNLCVRFLNAVKE
jgi:hypothetical protein